MADDRAPDPVVVDQFSYLETLSSRGIRTDTGPIREALALFDHPEQKVPVVLVGGTNGKGSVVAMVGEIIRHAEYLVGRYFSPHVSDVRERIVIDGEMIGRDEMARLIARIREGTEGRVDLTYFEFLTLAAYLFFAEAGADLAVVEVGMGGRYDATNVTGPIVSVVTTVSLDHTQYLGATTARIAREKAEIVHPGGALVAGRVERDVRDILKEKAQTVGARAFFLGEDFTVTRDGDEGKGPAGPFSYRGMKTGLSGLRLGLSGAHQADNAAVALAVVELLTERGYTVTGEAIGKGLAEVRLPGRLERISDSPEVIVDVAHNPAGADMLVAYLETLPRKKTAVVVGMMADKDVAAFLKRLDGTAALIILAPPRVPRAASVAELEAAAAGLSTPVRSCITVREGVTAARNFVGEGGRVVVTGSFYTAGEAMEEIGSVRR